MQTVGFSGVETGGNITSVYSPNGSYYYVGGYNGVYGSTFTQTAALQTGTQISTTNNRTVYALENDGGNLAIIGGGSGTDATTYVGTLNGFPTTTGQTVTQLPGYALNSAGEPTPSPIRPTPILPSSAEPGRTAGINTMYLTDNGTSYTNGEITKWSLNVQSITSIAESGSTTTATTSSALGLVVGETVTIAGVTPSGYNGTFTVTAVSGNTFSFTATSGLGTATAFGTATAWIENGSIPYTSSTPGYYFIAALTSGNTVTLNVNYVRRQRRRGRR